MKRSVWILEMFSDRKWFRSIDYTEAFSSQKLAEDKIKEIYFTHGKNVQYRAVRYAAQTK